MVPLPHFNFAGKPCAFRMSDTHRNAAHKAFNSGETLLKVRLTSIVQIAPSCAYSAMSAEQFIRLASFRNALSESKENCSLIR